MRVSLLAVLAVAFVMALGGTASAQVSPTDDAYGGVLGNEVTSNDGGGGAAAPVTDTQAADDGSLPFTGFEVAFVVLAGIGLVSLGFALRRGMRHPAA